MKKIIITTLLTAFLLSCGSSGKKKTVIVNGKIENTDADSVFIIKENFRKAFALTNGEFKDTLKIDESSYYQFISGRERTQIFLSPGDSLFISTDMIQFDEDLKYGGTSAEENNFLAKKQLEELNTVYANPALFFSVAPKAYKEKLVQIKEDQIAALEKSEMSKKFKELEIKNIEYQYYMMLSQYPMAHSYFTKNEVELPKDFEAELNELNFDDEADFLTVPSYHDLVLSKYSESMEELTTPEEVEKAISGIKSSAIRDAVMSELLLYKISSASPEAERYNEFIQEYAKDKKLKEKASDSFDRIQKLLPGKPSPKFKYPDINGKKVSLDDLEGNLVYIDVWATWCGPCLAEIPSMKKLEEDYRDKKIKFVGMSIDPKKDFDKWKEMVKEKDLQGIQIFADKDWKSQFVQDYGIIGIPRFILIDAEGNIITADAPRPSDPQIRALFDERI